MRSRCSEDPCVLNKMNGITTAGVDSFQGCRRPGLRTLPCRHSSRELTPQLTAGPWRDGPMDGSFFRARVRWRAGHSASSLRLGHQEITTAAVSAHLRGPLCSAPVTCGPALSEQPTDREAGAPAGPPSADTWPRGSVANPSPWLAPASELWVPAGWLWVHWGGLPLFCAAAAGRGAGPHLG